MPVVSKAQLRWAYAHAHDRTRTGEVAREMIEATHGKKVRRLPERKTPKARPRRRVFGSLAP